LIIIGAPVWLREEAEKLRHDGVIILRLKDAV
jgi:hypothetical protein